MIQALKELDLKGKSVLLARASEARDVLPRELTAAGARVFEAALYQTLPPDGLPPKARQALENGDVDLVTFTSSSTVTNLAHLLGDRLAWFKSNIPAACIGPITARTARETGFNVAVEAKEYTIDGLVQAVSEYFAASG